MRVFSSFVLLVAGMLAGVAFVVSCGDDAPGRADAAAVDAPAVDATPMCDCPAAEPPLTDRFVVVTNTQVIPANDRGVQSASCPSGSQIMSGSCTTAAINPVRDVTLQQSGFYDVTREWVCFFRNNEATPVTIKASAICLLPTAP